MSNWWACPRCGHRLQWLASLIECPNPRCGYSTPRPVPVRDKPAEEETTERF